MRFGPALDGPRLDPIRTLANAMRTNRAVEGIQQRLLGSGGRKQERWPKCVDGLEGSCEAQCTRHEPVTDCCCDHHAPQKIIGQDTHPKFLPYHGGRFPPDDIHPECYLNRPQIEFRMPPASIQIRDLLFGERGGCQQRRDHQQDTRAKPGPGHPHAQFAHLQAVGDLLIGGLSEPRNGRTLLL